MTEDHTYHKPDTFSVAEGEMYFTVFVQEKALHSTCGLTIGLKGEGRVEDKIKDPYSVEWTLLMRKKAVHADKGL